MTLVFGLIALIIVFLSWPLRIKVSYERMTALRSRARIKVYVLSGLWKIDRQVPGWLVIGRGFARSTEALAHHGDPYLAILHFFQTDWARFLTPRKIGRYLFQRIKILSLSLKAAVGTGDAAETAVLLGVLWAVIGSAATSISRIKSMKTKPVLELYPLYDRRALNIGFECIACLRPFHIIITVFLYLLCRNDQPNEVFRGGRVECPNIQSRA